MSNYGLYHEVCKSLESALLARCQRDRLLFWCIRVGLINLARFEAVQAGAQFVGGHTRKSNKFRDSKKFGLVYDVML